MSYEGIKDYHFQVAHGKHDNVDAYFKIACNNDLDMDSEEDIWDYGGNYTWSTTNDIDTISSSSANDTQNIAIYGLDIDYKEVIQTITLNGQNKVTLSTPLLRLWRMLNVSSTELEGNIALYVDTDITAGFPDDDTYLRAYILIGNNRTLMSNYTVPAGKTGFLYQRYFYLSSRVSGYVDFISKVRQFGYVWMPQSNVSISSESSGAPVTFVPPLRFSEKTDFVMSAISNVNNMAAFTEHRFIILKN